MSYGIAMTFRWPGGASLIDFYQTDDHAFVVERISDTKPSDYDFFAVNLASLFSNGVGRWVQVWIDGLFGEDHYHWGRIYSAAFAPISPQEYPLFGFPIMGSLSIGVSRIAADRDYTHFAALRRWYQAVASVHCRVYDA